MVLKFIGQLVDDLVSAFALALTLILILHFWRKPSSYVGAVVAGLAALSLALILTGKYGILCFSGAAALSVALGLLVHGFLKLSERLASSNNRLAEEIAMRSVRIEYGWDVLVFGAVLVIAAGVIRGAEDDVQRSVE